VNIDTLQVQTDFKRINIMKNATAEKNVNIKSNQVAIDLKLQIKSRIEAMGTNVRALERKAGLNIGTINNMLHRDSVNPTAETLIALSTAFDCSIDELLGKTKKSTQNQHTNNQLGSQDFQSFNWQPDLVTLIIAELNKQLIIRNITISSDKALNLIHEVYLYSLKKNKKTVEESLVEWLLDRS
jgi:transcriptional regulator with XRE-family HTH domain